MSEGGLWDNIKMAPRKLGYGNMNLTKLIPVGVQWQVKNELVFPH